MRVLIVVGSTRPVRVGDQIAGVARSVEDVRERALPLLHEPVLSAAAGEAGA